MKKLLLYDPIAVLKLALMKNIFTILLVLLSTTIFAQDISMQAGIFNRCAPDRFYDSGGEFGNYGNNEDIVTTICPQNPGEFIILDFVEFALQLNLDTIEIYDGDSTAAPLIDSYTGFTPFTVSASSSNTTGCLTMRFTSNDTSPSAGWAADILCATPCQQIDASIDATTPEANGSGVITILPGETVDFEGSATFSDDDSNATFNWDFGDGNTAAGTSVSHTFVAAGTYNVALTAADDNPQGCSDTVTISVVVLGQNVVVDQDTFTPEQLVEDVLVNSPCATVSNVISSTGTDFGVLEPNGIGYFVSNGVDFAFEEGIVLTTGNAANAEGPETSVLSEGSFGWPGDNDLENAIGLGLGSTNNASFLQFDFVPLSDNISFNFIFASEEYGGFQCSFTDAFAFLLTNNNTGVTTNIALVPGTTDVVSVLNVRDGAFNAGCGSVNPGFFDSFYGPGGQPAANSPINFIGYTTSMAAESNVIPGENYTIKLVIADDQDTQFDAAVFLEAGSFDLGGDLGEDITIAAGTAACGGDPITLNTGIDTASHVWFFNGVEIPGETGSTIEVTETGTYSVDIVFSGVCQASDEIFVEFRPNPQVSTANDLEVCDADGIAEFDLSQNDSVVLGSQDPSEFTVSYHLTEQDAIDAVNPLPTNYTNTSNPQTIWARLADNTQFCFSVTSFQLQFTSLDINGNISPLVRCDDNTADGITTFDLSERDAEIIDANDPAEVSVTYFSTLTDAENNVNPLPTNYTNAVPFNDTVFGRLERVTNSDCYNVTTVDLQVIENPIANSPSPIEACDINNDGITEFNLGFRDNEVVQGQANVVVTYHELLLEAEQGINALPDDYTNTTVDNQELYVRIENLTTGCFDTTTLQLIVNPSPTATNVTPFAICDQNNNGDEQEIFDLSLKTSEVINGQGNVVVNYFENESDAAMGINEIVSPYQNTANPQTIVAVLTNTTTSCTTNVLFDLVVTPLPAVIIPSPLVVCDDGIGDGFTEIDLSLKDAEISGGVGSSQVSYYLSLGEAESGINPLPVPYTNVSNPQTVFVRVEDVTTGCFDTTSLELEVEQAPLANVPQPLRYCDPDNDGFGDFDLTMADAEITGGVAGLTVSYHETQANADNGVDAIDASVLYNNIVVNTQTVYARVESATIATNCATVVPLELIVEPTPQLTEPTPLAICDDVSADGFGIFDLTQSAPEVLDGLDPLQYQVSYYQTQADADAAANAIATPTAYTNTVAFNQTIWIRVEDSNTVSGCYKLTSLELVVNALPVLVQPSPLTLCDVNNPGDEQEAFTLEDADAEILNGQNGITVSYYETQADADNAVNPIVSPYTNTSNAQTVYARAENDVTGCYQTITLTLRVDPIPSPEPDPNPIEVCDDDNDGFAIFDLEQRTIEITNGESNVVITYHETEEEAMQGSNAITGLYTNIVANSQQIYVRSESTITGCYSLTQNTLELIVVPSPEVPTTLEALVECDDNDDQLTQFDLTQRSPEVIGAQDPTTLNLSYHTSAADAATGNNPIINEGNYTNVSNPQTIYVRLFDPATGCLDTGSFELEVNVPPVAVQPTPLALCDDLGEAPGDEVRVFDLTVKDVEITGGTGSWSVSYYQTQLEAETLTNAIADPTQYTNTSVNGLPANPQTLYAVVTDTNTGCTDITTLTIRVLPNPTPTPSDQLPELILCDDQNTGDGVEEFDLTQNELLLLNGESGVTATYYETPEDANAGVNAIADPVLYENTQTPEQVIYVRVTNDVTGCYTLVDFTLRVDPLPEVVAVTDMIQCELNTDGFDSFDLSTKDAEVLNGQDPAIYQVSYHETLADAEAVTNALVSPYVNISNPQELFVAITNTVTGCSIATQRFEIEVQEAAQANPDGDAIVYEQCDDNMETDGDPSNDVVQFDLSTQDAEVLDGQDPANYTVSYYATLADAEASVNALPLLYENLSNPQELYARVDNDTPDGATGLDSSICYAITPLTLQVNPLPLFSLEPSYTLCIDSNGTEVINPPVLDTGLSVLDYSFEWSLNGAVLPLESGSSIEPTQVGTYQVIVTDLVTGCINDTDVGIAEVIESAPPSLELSLLTQAFSESHVIEAVATGISGAYEYSLDGGPWQDSGLFEGVSPGIRRVIARDKLGCGYVEAELLVMDYPLYFTPNGDGNNDTWNIIGINTQPNAKIYIFDRYGKLLKQLSPTGSGWDGTYNGNAMPSSDYWFLVEYNEPSTGTKKEFKAHFTLKR